MLVGTMDDWHRKVADQLVARTRAGQQPAAESELEVAFGRARAKLAYLLEFARAHRISVAGNVAGDDVWVQLGSGHRVRFTLNRRDSHILVRPSHESERVVRWDETRTSLTDATGRPVDLGSAARDALDALVAEWAAQPGAVESVTGAPPGREFEDEPTKG